MTTACDPKRSAIALRSEGSASAAELSDTRSAPDSMMREASSTERTPPPTVKGISTTSARAGRRGHGHALFGRGRDVEKDKFVGAAFAVEGGQFDRIAHVTQLHEADALDDATVRDVQAGN